MSLELVYTSAPRGLNAASSGFCTVAATGGISRQVRGKLESLSGYQFHFDLSDPQANLNPVNYAHTRVRIGAETLSVLSRIAFCGSDYSGRTNKIAHHVLLEHGEQISNGPAWMMMAMARGVFVVDWKGDPKHMPPRSVASAISSEPRPAKPATTWEAMTGDAGWGGVLAQAFRENPKVPAFVIFKPGQNLLPLFEESLALLPPEERWQVGFATYYTTLPARCQYHWRGVLAGSPASREVARFPNAKVVDLTRPLAHAEDSIFAEAARTGQTLAPVKAARRPKVRVMERVQEPVGTAAATGSVARPAYGEELPSRGPVDEMFAETPPARGVSSPRRSRLVPALVAAVVLLAISNTIFITIIITLLRQEPPGPLESVAQPPVATVAAPPQDAQDTEAGRTQGNVKPRQETPAEKESKGAGGQPGVSATDTSQPAKAEGAAERPDARTEPDAHATTQKENVKAIDEKDDRTPPTPKPDEQDVKGEDRPKPEPKEVRPEEEVVRIEPKLLPREGLAVGNANRPKVVHRPNENVWKFDVGDSIQFAFVGLPTSVPNHDAPWQLLLKSDYLVEVCCLAEGDYTKYATLLSCRIERARGKSWLICEDKEANAAKTNPNTGERPYHKYYSWLVLEVRDGNNAVHRCAFGEANTKEEQARLGYCQAGVRDSDPAPLEFEYPWPDRLTVSFGEVSEPLLRGDGLKDAHTFKAKITIDGNGDRGEKVIQPQLNLKVTREKRAAMVDRVLIQPRLATLDKIGQVAKRPQWNNLWDLVQSEDKAIAKADEKIKKAKNSNEKKEAQNDKKSAMQRKERYEAQMRELEKPIEDLMEAMDRFLQGRNAVEVRDPWGIPVATYKLRFGRCSAKNVMKKLRKGK